MTVSRPFLLCDVFTDRVGAGNGLAVVLDGADLSTAQMQAFAAYINQSETTFVLLATQPGASYRIRIFTPVSELPFAAQPSLRNPQPPNHWATSVRQGPPYGMI